jgi:signal peptidase I
MDDTSKQSFLEIIKFALTIILIVVPIRTFVAQPFIVNGESMFPTFDNGEYLIIDEFSYHLRTPERGEVVVFRYPKDPSKFFIKRIIGLPGETVTVRGTTVSVTDESGKTVTFDDSLASYTDNTWGTNVTTTLGSGEYFVMGDNRNRSLDSRSWGPVEEKLIKGRVFARLFPFSEISLLPGHLTNH